MSLRLTPAVKFLLAACLAMFLVHHTVDQFFGGNLIGLLGLSPAGFVFEHKFWQLFTYSFLHGDVMHFFLNMLMLAFLGGEIEALWGTARFVRFYLLCSTAGGLTYLLLQLVTGAAISHVPMVGASGALYGLLMAYGLLFGERVLLFMMVFPMKAKFFVWILAGLELMTTVFSPHGGVASAAHLGGMVAGFLALWGQARWRIWQRSRGDGGGWGRKPSVFSKRSPKAQHLKLVINNEKKVELRARDEDEKPPTFH